MGKHVKGHLKGKDCLKCKDCSPGPYCEKLQRPCTYAEIANPIGYKDCQKKKG